jgi:hypothetical protein
MLEGQLVKSTETLRKSMVQNVITLEYHKDVTTAMQSERDLLKKLQAIQEEHQVQNCLDFEYIA